MTPPGSDTGASISRKKRRGIIEKRRRDRINNSLTELRRLVPTAFEKQGSAKLEKAEILQMTVDHLKMLHAKGKYFVYLQNTIQKPNDRCTFHLILCYQNFTSSLFKIYDFPTSYQY